MVMRNIEQELVYFNTGWNPYLKRTICLCSDYDWNGTCEHIAHLRNEAKFQQAIDNKIIENLEGVKR